MLLPGAYTPSAVSALYCVPWNPSDSLEPMYDEAALQFNTDSDPSLAAIIKVALQNQMMLYRKAQCTDCATQGLAPTQTVINRGSAGIQTAAPVGFVQNNTTDLQVNAGINEAGSIATQIGTNVGGPAVGAVIGEVSGIISSIAGIFTQAHAAAVAKEQSINCAVAFAFNKYVPQYDALVATGAMSADAALAAVTQIIQNQLLPELLEVTSAHNWGWSAGQVLQAHLYFRQQWYPIMEANPVASGAAGVLSSFTSNPTLLIVAAVAAVALLGRKRA